MRAGRRALRCRPKTAYRKPHFGRPCTRDNLGYDNRVLVFSREVFVCRCATTLANAAPAASGHGKLVFRRGESDDLLRLDPAHHDRTHIAELCSRLDRGEHWLVGEIDGQIVTYSWLHRRRRAAYPTLPGCEIALRRDTAYGYDAWTPPEHRGQGLRRHAFAAELGVLKDWGFAWEASFFVKHQLAGAARSLAAMGIEVTPLWRVWLGKDRALLAEALHADAEAARPTWI